MEVEFGSQVASGWAWILLRIGKHCPSRVLPTLPFKAMITHIQGCSNDEAPTVGMTSMITHIRGYSNDEAPIVGMTSNIQS